MIDVTKVMVALHPCPQGSLHGRSTVFPSGWRSEEASLRDVLMAQNLDFWIGNLKVQLNSPAAFFRVTRTGPDLKIRRPFAHARGQTPHRGGEGSYSGYTASIFCRAHVWIISALTPPRPAPPPARRHFQRGNDGQNNRFTPQPPPGSVYIPPAGGSGSVWLVSALAGNYQTVCSCNYFDTGSEESCHFPENKVGLWARGAAAPPGG